VNESRKLCKVLLWDGTGLCIFMKRLERGCFAKLWRDDGHAVRLTQSELALYIEGCTLLDRRSLSPIAIERKAIVSDPTM
jgi:transposase